jgi:predicted MFS family arabinose efflux permease
MLAVGRLLMGVGMSACLMAAFTSINHWFDKSQVPSMNALIMTAGGLGAIFAAEPVQWLSLQFGWRNVFIIIAITCIISSVLLLLVVPHKQSPAASESSADAVAGIRKIFSSRIFWQVSAMTMCSQATAGAIIGLWSGLWLRDVGQLDPENIANMLRWIAISMTVGFLTIGNFAGWLNKRGVDFGQLTFGFMLLFLISQPLLLLPYGWWSVVGWVLFGFLGSSGILAYPLLTRSFDNKLAGRVNASLNLLVFLCSFAAQWGIGAIVKQWPANNNGFYPASAYQTAFAIIIVIQAIAIYYYWYNRNTAVN